MAFNYEKHKTKHTDESFWTSYSDLFLGLSSIFLLLYVTANLRSGTDGVRVATENQKLTQKVQELQNQLKMYEQVKEEYLQKESKPEELQEYTELMDKLTLLQDDARDEKNRLTQQAKDNEAKERALNKYQQMIRDIINSQKVSQSKLVARNKVIAQQDSTISDQSKVIDNLNDDVQSKQNLIADGQRKIQEAQQALEQQTEQLKAAYKRKQLSEKAYQKQLAKIKESAQSSIAALEGEKQQYENQLKEKEGDLARTRSRLASAEYELNARKRVAQAIKKQFGKTGVKAEVNAESGEVVLDFGDSYFATDSSKLTAKMKQVLEKAMPSYAEALFSNPKVAKEISSVEFIGFASPTYRGRYVDPNSAAVEDKEAIKYNMDLSYRRARSIFNHMLDERNNRYSHQKQLLPMMKVSGRSFLEVIKVDNDASNLGQKDFCVKYDCKKAQRVIIRFSVDSKK